MVKYNIKKLFKGEKVYGFGDGDYSYASSDSVLIKVLKGSPLHSEMKKELKFEPFNADRSKERIKECINKYFNLDTEQFTARLSSLIVDRKNMLGTVVFFGNEKETWCKQIQTKYSNVIKSWYYNEFTTDKVEEGPFYLRDKDYEMVIMPMCNIYNEKDVNDFIKIWSEDEKK